MASIAFQGDPSIDAVLHDCATTLARVAAYRLPPAVDQRLLWLSENKESLSAPERQELLGLAEMAEDRTVEKVQAMATLRRLGELFPDLVSSQP
jgi:hypothetical protein